MKSVKFFRPSPAVWQLCAMLAVAAMPLYAGAENAAGARDTSPTPVRLLAAGCANCHGTDGVGARGVAPLAGRPGEILGARMIALRDADADAEATVMGRLLRGYTDDELDALARHFAALEPDDKTAPEPDDE